MDNMVRTNARKPVRPQGAPQSSGTPSTQQSKKRLHLTQLLIGAVIGAALTLAALGIWSLLANQGQSIARDRYQAVFLDDGKVFFGRLQNTHGNYLTLEDAYYTQQQQSSASDGETSLQTSGQVNLVKVGEEIYGPDNSMSIRAEQVLFWQNLTSDNQIVKAIEAQNK